MRTEIELSFHVSLSHQFLNFFHSPCNFILILGEPEPQRQRIKARTIRRQTTLGERDGASAVNVGRENSSLYSCFCIFVVQSIEMETFLFRLG